MKVIKDIKIAVVGLGYVGLPLALEFAKKFDTIGFDISESRINQLTNGFDFTNECSQIELESAGNISYTYDINELKNCTIYIVTVPTPIDSNKRPNLTPLINASSMIGKLLSENDIVIYESTVFPGATEEECVPYLESNSGLVFNKDFYVGYSPERINPGDKVRRLPNIKKVVSGSTEEIANKVDWLYQQIITAGTHKASSIKVAEASKIIENTQRDVNIALINELHQVFNHMGICTKEVINAAATKWNFMKLMPGLVGGHCISVDPYYLLEKSTSVGYVPDLIRKAREINDSMAKFVVDDFIRSMIKNKIDLTTSNILILGAAFKENCPDIRNTKVVDVFRGLKELGINVSIYDPIVSKKEFMKEYGIEIITEIPDSITAGILLVAHDEIIDLLKLSGSEMYVYDFKNILTHN